MLIYTFSKCIYKHISLVFLFFELRASCIRPVYYRLRPFAFFEYTLLFKKKYIYIHSQNVHF